MCEVRDLITEDEIDAALERSKHLPDRPIALSAEYSPQADVVVLRLNNGRRLTIPREELQGLEGATEVQLSQIEIFAGVDIAWPQLDVDHYLPYLLEGSYGSEKWMKNLEKQAAAA